MKKTVFALVFFAGIVTISYLKVSYSQRNGLAATSEIQDRLVEDSILLARVSSETDSLRQLLSESELKLVAIKTEKEQTEGELTDSLSKVIIAQEKLIAVLSEKVGRAELAINDLKKQSTKRKIGKAKADKTEVIRYYVNRYKKLPVDLSEYERRVMVDELRVETANHFSLTQAELKNLLVQEKIAF